jgi:coatomer subunit beta
MANPDPTCFTVVWEDSSELPSVQDLRQSLEKGSDDAKLETLRRIIVATLNGNPLVSTAQSKFLIPKLLNTLQPQLLMPVIQYVMPSRSKALKKLLHFYWEVCPKHDENGKLKQEMILVWCVF